MIIVVVIVIVIIIMIIIIIVGGGRATKAKAYLEKLGYTEVLNGGGPKKPELFGEYSE